MTFFLELSTIRIPSIHVSVEADTLTRAIEKTQWWCLGHCAATGELPQIERADRRSKRGTEPVPLDDTAAMSAALQPHHFKEKL